MTHQNSLIESIRQRLERELKRAPSWEGKLLSITLLLPQLHLGGLPRLDCDHLFWSHPQNNDYRLGIGEAKRITATGENRLTRLSTAFSAIRENWLRIAPETDAPEPAVFCGFAFAANDPMNAHWQGLPNSGLFFPELLIQQQNNCCAISFTTTSNPFNRAQAILRRWLSLLTRLIEAFDDLSGPPGQRTTLVQTHSEPMAEEWLAQIARAKEEIRSNRLEKVVPARRIRIKAQRSLTPSRLMATLNCLYPSSYLFAYRHGERTFAAATPERLLACNGQAISCDAIAGTTERAATEHEDRQLAIKLLNNPKMRHEHALVVTSIKEALRKITHQLDIPARPHLIQLRNLQHLHTPIQGILHPGIGLLDAAARLHPTAAVNGMPAVSACLWLEQNESFARGWYTGAAGWLDASGNGELAVLLRCALLEGDTAELYAGAGITEGSEPQAEWDETELKLSTMLEALENA